MCPRKIEKNPCSAGAGFKASICSRESWVWNCWSPSSDLAPFCDHFRKREEMQKKKRAFSPFSNIFKSDMGKGKGHAGSYEEPSCKWQNLLWSSNNHSRGEPRPRSHPCHYYKALTKNTWLSEVRSTLKSHWHQQRWQMLAFLTEGCLLQIYLSPLYHPHLEMLCFGIYRK